MALARKYQGVIIVALVAVSANVFGESVLAPILIPAVEFLIGW